ncbi:putative NRPS-like enzyme [Ophiocordyceps camponoti-floridani]|uniref:Putative NRPS-like enzyme n=1 Tax=Ophiocordyceps camponoti-floridani TaxID=2030778 RepID=A0A8H4Q5Z8_9HYPO|nr:putative NRPS-like enzyme [Ophiocordyceps camponoti-floridani]
MALNAENLSHDQMSMAADIGPVMPSLDPLLAESLQDPNPPSSAPEETMAGEGGYEDVAVSGLGLAELFHRQTVKRAASVAVVDGCRTLTYRQLDARAVRLARVLNRDGGAAGLREEVVGIVVRHGVADVVAQMAVLYAGGSCAPMDPTLVDHQIEARLKRLGARFVLVDGENGKRAFPFDTVCIDDEGDDTDEEEEVKSWPDLTPGATTPEIKPRPTPSAEAVKTSELLLTPDLAALALSGAPVKAPLSPKQRLLREVTPASTPGLTSGPTRSGAETPVTYPVPTGPEHRTHLIHTSGTTGEAKAVQIAGRSVIHVAHHVPLEPLRSSDVVAHVNNSSFDVSLIDVWAPLLRGASIAVLSKAVLLDPPAMEREIERLGVTVMATTTALLNLVAFTHPTAFSGLRICFIGGEQANVGAIKVVLEKGPPGMLVNAYGPTECCVFCLARVVRHEDVEAGSVSIGTAIGRNEALVVDDEGRLSEEGELWIAGPGLSPGYANHPEKTEAAFPVLADGRRVYRTGDIVRRRQDGQMDYIGRRDHQVKVRGFRIELGAVEAALLQTALFSEAVALKMDIPRLGAGSILVAYVVPVHVSEPPVVSEALAKVRHLLPEYMVPQLEMVERLPLSSHAKVDRNKLAELFASRWATTMTTTTTTGEEEGKDKINKVFDAASRPGEVRDAMAHLWESILAVPSRAFGDSDDFISLGGSSLQASLLVSQIRQTFGLEIPLLTLYRDFSLGAVSSVVSAGLVGSVPAPPDERETWIADGLIGDALPIPTGQVIDWRAEGEGRVFVTGATGFVGAFLMADLMVDEKVERVCCLVRAADAVEGLGRIRAGMEKYGLWKDDFVERLLVVTGLLEDENLGLGVDGFEAVASWASVIFHLGARVNYTQPYGLHRAANTLGTLNVVRLSTAGHRLKPLHYVSSISCFGPTGLMTGAKLVREDEPLLRHIDALPLDHGYAQSQWVAERLVGRLIERGFPIAVYRPGFVTGHSRTGACNRDDFVSRLIEACCEMGCYPLLPNQRKEFVPVDYVCAAILHIAASPTSPGKAFHIVPPSREASVDMDATMDLVGRARNTPLRGVPYGEWVERLAVVAPLRLLPLQPMLAEKIRGGRTRWELYENMPVYDTSNTDAALADYPGGLVLPELDEGLMKRYIDFIEGSK